MSDAINSLLDANLDDLADLPEFGVYPAGVHRVTIKFESKDVNGHPCIELQMAAVETEELSDTTAEPLKVGQEGSVLYMLDNEFGQGKLKQVIAPLSAATGHTNLRAILEAAKGMEVSVVTKVRQNRDKTQSYTDVTKIIC